MTNRVLHSHIITDNLSTLEYRTIEPSHIRQSDDLSNSNLSDSDSTDNESHHRKRQFCQPLKDFLSSTLPAMYRPHFAVLSLVLPLTPSQTSPTPISSGKPHTGSQSPTSSIKEPEGNTIQNTTHLTIQPNSSYEISGEQEMPRSSVASSLEYEILPGVSEAVELTLQIPSVKSSSKPFRLILNHSNPSCTEDELVNHVDQTIDQPFLTESSFRGDSSAFLVDVCTSDFDDMEGTPVDDQSYDQLLGRYQFLDPVEKTLNIDFEWNTDHTTSTSKAFKIQSLIPTQELCKLSDQQLTIASLPDIEMNNKGSTEWKPKSYFNNQRQQSTSMSLQRKSSATDCGRERRKNGDDLIDNTGQIAHPTELKHRIPTDVKLRWRVSFVICLIKFETVTRLHFVTQSFYGDEPIYLTQRRRHSRLWKEMYVS